MKVSIIGVPGVWDITVLPNNRIQAKRPGDDNGEPIVKDVLEDVFREIKIRQIQGRL